MVSSKAATVEEYLQELPPERQAVIAEVRETIRENLPAGYTETMNWGMISYEIPLDVYPDTYNGQPLSYVALAAQKNHYAVYMSGVYQDPKQEKILLEGFEKTGKKPDMGKSCVRFRKLENIPLEVIGQLIASTPPEKLIAIYEESRN
jgi:uncharacterized protein YdhG (YjbR/CyaY superfamily)